MHATTVLIDGIDVAQLGRRRLDEVERVGDGLKALTVSMRGSINASFEAGAGFAAFVAMCRTAYGLPPSHYNPTPNFGLRARHPQ